MNRRFAHLSKEQLEQICDTPFLSDSGNKHTITNNPSQDQVDSVAELERRKLEENLQKIQSDIQKLTKPHWTLVPIFWIALAALIVAILQFFQPLKSIVQGVQYLNPIHSTTTRTFQGSQPTPSTKEPISKNKPDREKP